MVRRTRATLRSAELGFFGVVVYTRVQTPRFCGHWSSAGTLFLAKGCWRDLRINWLIVGIRSVPQNAVGFRCTTNARKQTACFPRLVHSLLKQLLCHHIPFEAPSRPYEIYHGPRKGGRILLMPPGHVKP